ncbi:TVP38/TMEM64 family protein [uncultured Eubacterium sp.]|uniref:TVP38/TMEM64 family protein n=1 Tax=uncultured Eubacterium sp. TaxID=165185 RepID=UPI0026725B3B|nr:VTT domain-containing protein [uncultured Eubacterium sp.]
MKKYNLMKKSDEISSNNIDDKRIGRKRKIISIIGLLIFVILSVAIAVPVAKYFNEPEMFRDWVDSFGMWGGFVCVGAMVLQIIIAIIPGGALEIGAGYAFGAIPATIFCTIGSIIGCAIVFWFVRVFGVKFVEAFFPIEKIQNLKFLQNEKKRNILVFIIFLIPGMPKDLISYFMGLTNIKLSVWLVISTVARFPAILVSAMGGHALGTKQYTMAVVVLVIIMLISMAGALVYKKITMTRNEE